MNHLRYIASIAFLSFLDDKKRKLNVSSSSVVGDLNKKIETVEQFIEQEHAKLLAEIEAELKSKEA